MQLVVSTHSPLVLASAEPWFEPEQDAWFDLDVEGTPPRPHLRQRTYEPDAFDEMVRQPGRRALDRLAAEKYSGSKETFPAREIPPHWRRSLDDLLAAYQRICSYLCLYIPRGTGARSVDHMVPKSLAWDQSYEWNNYRLACD